MLDLSTNSDPANILRLAVLDDITPAAKGTDICYWKGMTDFDPRGKRRAAFDMARSLSDKGRLFLFQRKISGDVWAYCGRVM